MKYYASSTFVRFHIETYTPLFFYESKNKVTIQQLTINIIDYIHEKLIGDE